MSYNQDIFLRKSNEIHGNEYDYSLVEYINTRSKVKIICKEHGIFEQSAGQHLCGCGCRKCSIEKRKKTTIQFIKDSIKVHGDKYDYTLVDYKDSKTTIKIICKEHGIFEQLPNVHLNSYGCQICAEIFRRKSLSSNKDEFVKFANKKHNNKYNYSLVDYKNSQTKIKIICKEHGIFEQIPHSHLIGQGCVKCGGKLVFNTEEFIENSIKKHGDKYDYSLVDYKMGNLKIKIICKEHGIFEQIPSNHLKGTGCPKCKSSNGEKEIKKLLENNKILFETQKGFNGCKYKKQLKFDFYLPNYDVCIEFDGIQHYEIVKAWGGEERFQIQQLKDKIKNNYCINNNIKLIRIRYDENIEEKLKDILN